MPKKKTETTRPTVPSDSETTPDEAVLQDDAPTTEQSDDGSHKNGFDDVEIEETEIDVDIEEFAKRMDLEILYSGSNERIHFGTFNISRPGLQLAGYYKHFSAERVQVIGEMEMAYLQQMTHNARKTEC